MKPFFPKLNAGPRPRSLPVIIAFSTLISIGILACIWAFWSELFTTCSGFSWMCPKPIQAQLSLVSSSSSPTTTSTPNTSRTPPQPPPSFTGSPLSIIEDTKSCISQTRQLYDTLTSDVPESSATFDKVLRPLAHAENICGLQFHLLGFYKSVMSDQLLRNASIEAVLMMEGFETETCQHGGLYRIVAAVARREKGRGQGSLSTEEARYLDDWLRCFKGHGLSLNKSWERERYADVQRRLGELQYAFAEGLKRVPPVLELTEDALEGMPGDWLGSLKIGSKSGMYSVSLGQREVSLLLQYAVKQETRRLVYLANENRNRGNADIFTEIVKLRSEAAEILGFENHADRLLRGGGNIFKDFGDVNDLLGRLKDGVWGAARREMESLRNLKETDLKRREKTFDGRYYPWDHHFYTRLQAEETQSQPHHGDEHAISVSFPVDHVLASLLNLVEHLFGMEFEEMHKPFFHDFQPRSAWQDVVWHEDVRLLTVWDRDNTESHEDECFLGYLYLDLFPRRGKFGHVANFLVQPGFTFENGTRWYPVTALLGNFPSSTHLRFGDVVTLFHELGHCVHNLVSRTRFSRFHGTRVAKDFAEAPSQLLENWCWDGKILEMLSSGSDVNGQSTPSSTATFEKFLLSQISNTALSTLQQIHIAAFDMAVHQISSPSSLDINTTTITTIYNHLRREIVGFDTPGGESRDGWTHGYANFPHLVWGYDAGYYGYLNSRIYSTDIFHSYFEDDLLNGVEMRRFRRGVLEKGGSVDAKVLLEKWLGRRAMEAALFQNVGLSQR